MTALSIDRVRMEYDGRTAVDGVSFTLDKGEFLVVAGENGSGKSTLIKGILGLLPLAEGTVTFGQGIKRDEVGYLPQQTHVQKDFPASVYEVVLSGCIASIKYFPFYSKREKLLADKNIRHLGIEGLKYHSYRDLSGGQQQRALLARALCAARGMLILDEPTAGLDPVISTGLYSILAELNRDMGMTVIMVSHDIKAAMETADKVLHLGRGDFFFGSHDEYAASDIGKRFIG